jgi:hypothetical protein
MPARESHELTPHPELTPPPEVTPHPELAPLPSRSNDLAEFMTPIEKAEALLAEWEKLLREKDGDFNEQDAVAAQNNVKTAINLTAFQIGKANLNRKSLYQLFARMHKLSMATIDALESKYGKLPAENTGERERYRLIISAFRPIAKYAIAYRGEMVSFEDLDLNAGEIMPSKKLAE